MNYDILDITLQRVVTLCGMNMYPTPEYHPDRVMSEHDLLFICEGEWTVIQDGQSYPLKAGDAIFLRAGNHHASEMPCTPGTRTLFVHFSRLPGERYDEEITAEALKAYSRDRSACIMTVTSCGQNAEVQRLMRQIIDNFWSERDDKARQSSLMINLLLSELSYIARHTLQNTDEWISRALRLFRSEPARIYSLEEIAKIAGISVRTLSTRFKQITGQGVHRYQLNLKLEMAYAAIRTTDRTIQDIAAGFGFYDAYQFSKLFKRKYGMPPRHFKPSTPRTGVPGK
jgi:AraC-like DNA-binding protein/mannose-6-phosphate isomerase-like protein (cupin superfamily)